MENNVSSCPLPFSLPSLKRPLPHSPTTLRLSIFPLTSLRLSSNPAPCHSPFPDRLFSNYLSFLLPSLCCLPRQSPRTPHGSCNLFSLSPSPRVLSLFPPGSPSAANHPMSDTTPILRCALLPPFLIHTPVLFRTKVSPTSPWGPLPYSRFRAST